MQPICRVATMLLLPCAVQEALPDERHQQVLVQQVGGFDTNVWTGGKRLGIALDGEHAYLGGDRFYVVNIKSPRHPRTVGSCELPAVARDVAILGQHAFVATDNAGLRVLDISDPRSPREVGFLEMPGDSRCVAVRGKMCYVGDPGNAADQEAGAVRIVDISNPREPRLVGSFEYPSVVLDIEVGEKFVYIGDRNGRLLIADLADPSSPKLIGEARGLREVTGVKLAGRFVHVSDNDSAYHIVDASNPASPRKVATIRCDGIGRLPVVTRQADGSKKIVRLPAPGIGSDVHPDGRFAWVTGVTGRVALIDHSEKSRPQVVALFDTRLRAYGVTVRENLAYVNCDQGRLVVLQRSAGKKERTAAAAGFVASLTRPRALAEIGPGAVPALLPAMHDPDSTVRAYASHALTFIRPHEQDIARTTEAWKNAIGDRRGGPHHGAPIYYVIYAMTELQLPASSQKAIGAALASQLADEQDGIHKVATETLLTISRHSDRSRQLILSCLRRARQSDDTRLRDNAMAVERAITAEINQQQER